MSNLEPKAVADAIQADSSGALVRALRGRIDRIEGGRRPRENAVVSSGCRALDRLLPERGFRRGTLVEWLATGEASGVETLALVAAREACGKDGVLVVFDQQRQFYPPGAVRLGIDPGNLIVVRAVNRADETWGMDQALRCPGVAVVLAWPDGLTRATPTIQKHLQTCVHDARQSQPVDGCIANDRGRPTGGRENRASVGSPAVIGNAGPNKTTKRSDFRRLQLAAEEGGGLGLLVRPQGVQHEPSWAEVRLLVEPLPMSASGHARRMRIRVLRCRGGTGGSAVEVEINDETHTVHSVSRLAGDAVGRRAAGA